MNRVRTAPLLFAARGRSGPVSREAQQYIDFARVKTTLTFGLKVAPHAAAGGAVIPADRCALVTWFPWFSVTIANTTSDGGLSAPMAPI